MTHYNHALFARYTVQKLNKFDRWISKNPLIYRLFVRFAEQYRSTGSDRCSAALIGNRIRWEVAVKTSGEDGFKISNDYFPLLARKLAVDDPSFINF